MTMEVRTHANISPYVATSARKVAETPLTEGEYSDAYKTYGPFNGESMKGYNNKKAEENENPIEKAIDSILIFFDDVREASETQRERCGEMTFAANGTLERFTEGICKNPCMEDCSRIQPPADLMLSVENREQEQQQTGRQLDTVFEDEEAREPAQEVAAPMQGSQGKLRDYSLSKENSVKDMSVPEAEGRQASPGGAGEQDALAEDHQDTIQMFKDTMVSAVPDEYKAQLKAQLDYYLPNEGILGVESPVYLPEGEYPVDEDPVVEAIDRLILMFDELKESMLEHKVELMKSMEERKMELLQKASDLSMAARAASMKVSGKSIADKSEATSTSGTSEETVKTMNKKSESLKDSKSPKKSGPPKILPSMSMRPDEYTQAVIAAASILAETAPEEDREKYTSEELHQRALERIMSERSDYEEEYASGTAEYKSEQEILSELMKEADQAIMDTRSYDEKDNNNRHMPPSHCPTDELTVLETSVTLTPIPEADEETSGAETPALSEKLEVALEAGNIPEVPVANKSETQATIATDSPANAESKPEIKTDQEKSARDDEAQADDLVERQNEELSEEEENDPIIKVIDSMFLCYDDVKEHDVVNRGCAGCIGDKPTDSDITELKEMMSDDAIQALNDPINLIPRSEEEPQKWEEESTDGKDYTSPIDLTTAEDQAQTTTSNEDPVVNAIDDLVKAFDEAKNQEESLRGLTEKLNSLKDYIVSGRSEKKEAQEITDKVNAAYRRHELRSQPETKESQENPAAGSTHVKGNVEFELPDSLKQDQDPYIAWGGDDSELMASINADRKLSELEHENIFRDVSKGLDASRGGITTIYNAPAFTEGNSSSRSNSNEEERVEKSTEQAGLKILDTEGWSRPPTAIVSTDICASSSPRTMKPSPEKMKTINNGFQGWSLSKKREQMLKAQVETSMSV